MWRRSCGRACWRISRCGTMPPPYQMALINRGIHPELETLLLPASAAYQHFSSSMAREMIRYHQPLENYLPASIVPLVREMTEKKEG